jgi:hypothetical protein
MKTTLPIIGSALLMAWTACAQSFVNLNFESADVSSPDESGFYFLPTSSALPGWQSDRPVYYNIHAMDQVAMGIFDSGGWPFPVSRPVFGNFTAFFNGDLGAMPSATSANIWQSGLVPANALSLQFVTTSYSSIPELSPTLRLFINDTPVAYSQIGVVPNGILWGCNVGGVAGSIATLKFGVSESYAMPSGPSVPHYAFFVGLDEIAFSPTAIPEPGSLALCVAGWLSATWMSTRSRKL